MISKTLAVSASEEDILNSGINLKTWTPLTGSTLVYLEVNESLDLFHCSTLTLADFKNFGIPRNFGEVK